MKQVQDYFLSASTRIVILLFEGGHGITVSKQGVNNYLADNWSNIPYLNSLVSLPMDFEQLHRTGDKCRVLALLTEYFEHKQNTPV